MGWSSVFIVFTVVASFVTLCVMLVLVVKLPAIPPVVVFLVVIGFIIALLLVINHVANLYLSGYFISDDHGRLETKTEFGKDSETDKSALVSGSQASMDAEKKPSSIIGMMHQAEKLHDIFSSEEGALKVIQKEGFEFMLACRAILTVKLEMKSNGCLFGALEDIVNLTPSDNEDFRELCFHVKLYPSKKRKTLTNWKAISTSINVGHVFTMAKLTEDVQKNDMLCIRLYGRGSAFTGKTCLGQIFIPLSKVGGKVTTFRKRVMPYTKAAMRKSKSFDFFTNGNKEGKQPLSDAENV